MPVEYSPRHDLDLITIAATQPKGVEVKLDWMEYFYRFAEQHGGSPVWHNNKLLFADGWQYGNSHDYTGPEWRPPEDPREYKALIKAYYTIRKGMLDKEVLKLSIMLEELERAQSVRSAPLQHRYSKFEDGKLVMHTIDLDLGLFKEHLLGLKADSQTCSDKLAELNGATEKKETNG